MKKAVVIICIMLCACAVFAKTMSVQAGFSILGMNGGAAVIISDKTKIGFNASGAVMANSRSETDPTSWLMGQGFVSFDVIKNTANDLDLRIGLTYLHYRSEERVYYSEEEPKTVESSLKFAGLTFGIQYSHWFGEKRSHGIYVGIDFPVGGFTSSYSYGSVDERGPFVGPFSSLATVALLGTSLRTGYCYQF